MRIRTVKPEFFTHEGLYELERETRLPIRLAFIGLWGVADREGKFRWEPRRIGIQILPYDEIAFSDILESLELAGFIIKSNCGMFGKIPSFLSHQCINIREAASTIPEDAFTCDNVQAREPQYNYKGVNIQPKLREFVYLRDNHKCKRCDATEDLTVDHIFPQSIGGTHAPKNLRTLCRACNSARPVQGKGLVDDLAKDGLTLDDMERICMHVHARVEGKGREGNMEGKGKDISCPIASDDSEILDIIWKSCPKVSKERSSKKDLAEQWAKIKASKRPDKATLETALDAWNKCAKWQDGYAEGIHIWVAKEQWENLPEPASVTKKASDHGTRHNGDRATQEQIDNFLM